MHLWHDIEPQVSAHELRAIVEIAMGSRQKYELLPDLGILAFDRSFHTSGRYPCNYGFIPRTLGLDGDPSDILIISEDPIQAGMLVSVRPIGAFNLITDGESDHKIISVPTGDPYFAETKTLDDLTSARVDELKQFLQTYKSLEGKKVKVGSFWGIEKAWEIFEKAAKRYQKSPYHG